MWTFRVKQQLGIVWPNWDVEGADTAQDAPILPVQNWLLAQVMGCISNEILLNYKNETSLASLMRGLAERFDPQTTMTESNDIGKLFSLRRPVKEFNSLLDDLEQTHSRILARHDDFPDYIYYAAIVGSLPPYYKQAQLSYEASHPDPESRKTPELISLLRYKFADYKAQKNAEYSSSRNEQPRGQSDRGQSYRGGNPSRSGRGEGQGRAHAHAASPYSRPAAHKKGKKTKGAPGQVTCYNCGKEGHMTADCTEAWTPKSQAAMKEKGIKPKPHQMALSSKSGSAHAVVVSQGARGQSWLSSVSSSDAASTISSVRHTTFTLPVYTALTSQNMLHLIDSGATIYCTPYMSRLYNVHSTDPLTITVANQSSMTSRLKGQMCLSLVASDQSVSTITLESVYYCPEMPFSLLSVSLLDKLLDIHF